jgi:hypothetical protein
MTDYLAKPVEPADIVRMLNRRLPRHPRGPAGPGPGNIVAAHE